MPANYDEKTEAPTPRRRMEARNKGQVARSQDLPAAALLLVSLPALWLFGPRLWGDLVGMMTVLVGPTAPSEMGEILNLAGAGLVRIAETLTPLLLTLFVTLLLSLLVQVGFLLTLQPLVPSLSKLNPISGIQRLFSLRSVMTGMLNFAKLLAVGSLAYMTVLGSAGAIMFSAGFDIHDVFMIGASLTFELGIKLGAALFLIALLDFAWQRYRHERDLRMTKEEVKDEMRSMEGDPEVKRRRRQVQMQLAMQRLSSQVPKADVVVTNPTHLAIAIEYDADAMLAPRVVAKGADYLALRIRQIAQAHGIPIVERKPLARAMYDVVEPGDYIPERFYRAVAEILAYIYELTGESRRLSRKPKAQAPAASPA